MKSSLSKQKTGAGLPAGRAMDSESVPRQIGKWRGGERWSGHTHLIYSKCPSSKTPNEAMSTTLSRQCVAGLPLPAFAFGLVPYRSAEKKKKRIGVVSLPRAEPPLPGHAHTSLIRTGVFCGCSGDGSLKRLGLGTAPALFPSSPRHIPSRKHFICGGGKAYVGLESAV